MPVSDPTSREPRGDATPSDTSKRAAKNIVLLSDGTGNAGAKAQGTNVWALYEHVYRGPDQVVFYDDGVGTQKFLPVKLVGGAFGYGLFRNVKDLYTSLVRVYRPGDRIYLFGFSRGAYTVRTLAGLITKFGIVDRSTYHSEQDLAEAIDATCRSQRATFELVRAERAAAKSASAAKGSSGAPPASGAPKPTPAVAEPPRKRRMEVRARGGRPVERVASAGGAVLQQPGINEVGAGEADPGRPVEFVGVWDTVDAVGVPIPGLTWLLNRIYQWQFPDLTLNAKVKRARHALSIDDERKTFHPNLWKEAEGDVRERECVAPGHPLDDHDREPGCVRVPRGPRIQQAWFAGVHTNVGGGYDKDQLAYLSFAWMIEHAKAMGLRFPGPTLERLQAMADANGMQYDSRAGPWAFYRYAPRAIARLCREGSVRKALVHHSVLERIDAAPLAYAPIHLPPDAEFLPPAPRLRPMEPTRLAEALRVVRWRQSLYAVQLAMIAGPLVAASAWLVGWPVWALLGRLPQGGRTLTLGLSALSAVAVVLLLAVVTPRLVRSERQRGWMLVKFAFGLALVVFALAATATIHAVVGAFARWFSDERRSGWTWTLAAAYAVVVLGAMWLTRRGTKAYRLAAMDALAPVRAGLLR